MKLAIENASQFRDEFRQCGRADQFSYEALGLLFDYLEEIDPDYELDVIAICCEYSEDSAANIARNYGIDLNDCDPESGDYEEQCADAVLAYLNNHTSVVGVTPSGIVYADF
jgi:hypothetical protein